MAESVIYILMERPDILCFFPLDSTQTIILQNKHPKYYFIIISLRPRYCFIIIKSTFLYLLFTLGLIAKQGGNNRLGTGSQKVKKSQKGNLKSGSPVHGDFVGTIGATFIKSG